MKAKYCLPFILVILIVLCGCGKTDEDERMEEDIIGYWIAKTENGDPENNIPDYIFEEDNEGYTTLNGSEDPMTWEITRGQLKVYYDEAPDYIIGYDKYNSRSLFEVHKLEGDHLEVTQFYNDGFQADLDFYKD
ncbi:MAG: hypothetical protein ACQES1_10020 [Bacteroidota bacterium]